LKRFPDDCTGHFISFSCLRIHREKKPISVSKE
jgi:hypothetical protein